MSYTLYKTNGTLLTTVVDGSLENSTDLTFVGKNYSGYGTIVNQNLVKLLENFSGKAQPTRSLTGQLWYDTTAGKLKVNIGSYYKPIANIESGSTAPTNAVKTDLWYNESTEKLNFFNGSSWVVIGPQISGATANNLVEYASILDDGGTARNVLQHNIQGVDGSKITVAVTSPAEFTVNSSEGIKSNFFSVKKGITLAGTDPVTGVGSSNNVLWGNASNALKFNGFVSDDFIKRDSAQVRSTFTSTNDLGFNINNITRIRNEEGNTTISNLNPGAYYVSLKTNVGGGLIDILNVGINDSGVPTLLPTFNTAPNTPQVTNIGTLGKPFNSVYANSLNVQTGTITGHSIVPDGTADSTVGTSNNKFETIYATKVYATNVYTDSVVSDGKFAVAVYANTSLRDAAFGGTIPTGALVLCGNKFQGYDGSSWVDLN